MPYSGRCKVCRPSGRAICSLLQHNLKRAWRAGLSTPVTRARSMSKASAAEVPVPSQKFLCLIVSSPAGIGLGALEADSFPARHASMAHHISRLADKALCHENVFKKRAAQSETPANWACLRWCSTLMSKFDSCRALLGTARQKASPLNTWARCQCPCFQRLLMDVVTMVQLAGCRMCQRRAHVVDSASHPISAHDRPVPTHPLTLSATVCPKRSIR